MSIHNILCTVCKEVLKSTDDIYSTNCGHIFHYPCMLECVSRSTCCPECQIFNPATYKMYLIFNESNDAPLSNNWNDKLKILELHKQIEDIQNNLLHLQEKYVTSQDSVRKLEGRIKKADNSNLQRTQILSDLEDRVKTLEDLNHFLTIDNDCKSQALSQKSIEISELQNSLAEIAKPDAVPNVLSRELNILNRQLENQSMQLDNEVANNMQLTTEKVKLQKYIDLMELESRDKGAIKKVKVNNEVPSFNSSGSKSTKVACAFNSIKSNENATGEDKSNYSDTIESQGSTEDSNLSTDSTILIKNFPKNKLIYPLKELIAHLASFQEEWLFEDDICDVYIEDSVGKIEQELPKKLTLFVNFKNIDVKNRFLSNEFHIYKVYPYIELTEVNYYKGDDAVEDLLIYAKQKLCGNGFKKIYRQNNDIIAFRHHKDSKGTIIISKNQVNKLSKLKQNKKFI